MSGAVGSTPRYTRRGLPAFADCSSLAFNSSSRMISAAPLRRYASCSSTGLNFAEATIFSPALFRDPTERGGLRCDIALPAQVLLLRCKCDVLHAGCARLKFPVCPDLRWGRRLAARSARRQDFRPRSGPCSLRISRRVPEPGAAIRVPETQATATDEYSRCDSERPRRNAPKAGAYSPRGRPDLRFFRATPLRPICRRLRVRGLSTRSLAFRCRARALSRFPELRRDC